MKHIDDNVVAFVLGFCFGFCYEKDVSIRDVESMLPEFDYNQVDRFIQGVLDGVKKDTFRLKLVFKQICSLNS